MDIDPQQHLSAGASTEVDDDPLVSAHTLSRGSGNGRGNGNWNSTKNNGNKGNNLDIPNY